MNWELTPTFDKEPFFTSQDWKYYAIEGIINWIWYSSIVDLGREKIEPELGGTL
jgi:hypothetical protein